VDAERYARVRMLFDALAELPRAQREPLLDASDEDPEVVARVRSLLSSTAVTGQISAPVAGLLAAMVDKGIEPGTRLGAWTLERKIGEGGMGTVYLSRRSDGHFEQVAAVKLLRGVPSAPALEYIARERQILATLNHPSIARLLDGGATPAGEPYLVMEYLDGEPIDRHCREQRPGLGTLLHLLIQICEAVAYAHTRLVVHCDLKPSNILVLADGRPCLLDFGIARLLGEADRGEPSSISQRARAFTPGFASPEQESGSLVSTASDVFSLGRLIEHLTAQAGLATDAELRALIVHATAADPDARYESAAALASDLRRYLARLPLQAMPPRITYRVRKWLQRRWPLALTAALFAATVFGFTLQLARDRDRALAAERAAVEERDRAATAEQAARQVSDFVVSILDGANPDAGGAEVPVSRLVEQALGRIETELAGQPALQAQLYATLAEVQTQLRAPEQAQASFERAVAIERTLARGLPLARVVLRLARHVLSSGSADAAQIHAHEALDLYQALGAQAPVGERLQAMRVLGQILIDTPDPAKGLGLLRDAVAQAEVADSQGEDLAFALLDLGSVLHRLGEPEEAEQLLRRSVALFRAADEAASESSLNTLNAREVLARLLVSLKQHVEAEQLLREALEQRRALHGADDVSIPWRLSELASLLDAGGRSLEAMPLYTEAVDLAERKLGADGVHHAVLLQNQARSRYRAGDFATAEANYARALAALLRHWGTEHAGVGALRTNFGQVLLAAGRLSAASSELRAAEAVLAARQPGNLRDLALVRVLLAEAQWRQGNQDDAHRWLKLTEDVELAVPSTVHAERLRVGALLATDGRDADAILAGFSAAEAAWTAAVTAGDPRAPLARLDRAEWLARSGSTVDREQARTLAGQILTDIDARIVPDSPWRARIARLQAP